MSEKLAEVPKQILLYIIQKIKDLRAFWKFLRNPREELKNTTPREVYPELLKNPIYGNHEFIKLPELEIQKYCKAMLSGDIRNITVVKSKIILDNLLTTGQNFVYYPKGLNLHYVESGSKDKELLVLVHGFPDFWFTWRHQIAELSRDYWVIAVDMRGYGDTEKSKKVSFYEINLLVNDLRNLVVQLGREKFSLIAHDWGGVVAHYFIRIHPQMLNKYILMNTVFHPKLSESLFSDFKQFLKSWYIMIMQIPYYGEYFFLSDDLKKFEILYEDVLTPEELEIYKFMFGSYERIRGPINYYRANFKDWRKELVPNAERLNKENVPGLYIHGEDDFAITLNMAFTASFEDVKNVRLVCIPNAGHFVHLHSPERVNKIIRSFLKSNNGGRANA